jgi:hypothetical protein
VVLFDYRTVGGSGGVLPPTRDGLIMDGISVLQFVTADAYRGGMGVRAEDVVIWGHSLGGGIAAWALVGHHCGDNSEVSEGKTRGGDSLPENGGGGGGTPAALILDRTFSRLSAVVASMAPACVPDVLPRFLLRWIFEWEVDVDRALAIGSGYTGAGDGDTWGMGVGSGKRRSACCRTSVVVIGHSDDPVIPDTAAFYPSAASNGMTCTSISLESEGGVQSEGRVQAQKAVRKEQARMAQHEVQAASREEACPHRACPHRACPHSRPIKDTPEEGGVLLDSLLESMDRRRDSGHRGRDAGVGGKGDTDDKDGDKGGPVRRRG